MPANLSGPLHPADMDYTASMSQAGLRVERTEKHKTGVLSRWW